LHLSAPDDFVRTEMKTTRIEVPLTPAAPHFDDDATIATARQVVPIKDARRIQWRRKTLTLAPLLIASTFCGALGAVAVNYYERRRDVSAPTTQAPVVPSFASQAKPGPSPVMTTGSLPANQTEIAATVPPKDPEVAASEAAHATDRESTAAKTDDDQLKSAPAAAKREITDAAKLVRKRRVLPNAETSLKKKGAGGIEDLFSGPNP